MKTLAQKKAHLDYDESFLAMIDDTSSKSAIQIVPIVVSMFRPESVLDVGCGRGAWLRVFIENGIKRVQGIDGDYINTSKLLIPINSFRTQDFARSQDFGTEKFDLTVCLEVAEHIDAKHSINLIKGLTSTSDLILFSAALPNQPGTHHINCRPLKDWVSIFAERGYTVFDFLRPLLWLNLDVSWWFRQNIVVFARNNSKAYQMLINQEFSPGIPPDLIMVHQEFMEPTVKRTGFKTLLTKILQLIRL